MSTEIWNNPNDPNPNDPIIYPIGTEGVEHAKHDSEILTLIEDFFHTTYPWLPKTSAIAMGWLELGTIGDTPVNE